MAVNQILLVSEEKIKAYTTIQQNVSPKLLIPFILQAQDVYLTNLIGSTFYNELKLQVRTNTVTADNAYFLDEYVGNVVLNYGMMMATPFMHYQYFNKGILAPKSETSESIDLDEVKYLVTEIRNVADMYADLLQKFLFWHNAEYPLWNTANARDGILPDKGNVYVSPLVTPHAPYAFKKRLAQTASRGQYGYALSGDMGALNNVLCDGFPWWIYTG